MKLYQLYDKDYIRKEVEVLNQLRAFGVDIDYLLLHSDFMVTYQQVYFLNKKNNQDFSVLVGIYKNFKKRQEV